MKFYLKSQQGLTYNKILEYYPSLDYYDLGKVAAKKQPNPKEDHREMVSIDIDSIEELSKIVKDLDLKSKGFGLSLSVSDNDDLTLMLMDWDWDYTTESRFDGWKKDCF